MIYVPVLQNKCRVYKILFRPDESGSESNASILFLYLGGCLKSLILSA